MNMRISAHPVLRVPRIARIFHLVWRGAPSSLLAQIEEVLGPVGPARLGLARGLLGEAPLFVCHRRLLVLGELLGKLHLGRDTLAPLLRLL
eukprot:6194132-Pleurochrysis_carterae.AAC.6